MATITGTSGDDKLAGTSEADEFHLEQGGHDKAVGGAGDDVFFLGSAFDAEDTIDGGPGHDIVVLAGFYTDFVFRTSTMLRVETLQLTAGFSYGFSGLDTVSLSTGLLVDGSALLASDRLAFDGSSLHEGSLTLLGGAGSDVLAGGGGGDSLDGGAGADLLSGGQGDDMISDLAGADTLQGGFGNDVLVFGAEAQQVLGGSGDDLLSALAGFDPTTRIDGGDGFDTLELAGGAYRLGGKAILGVDAIVFSGATVFKPADSLVAAGGMLQVSVLSGQLEFNGAKELDGAFVVLGAGRGDELTGGAGADRLMGRNGDDLLTGGGGADTLDGGKGRDHFLYGAVQDSAAAAPDQIVGLEAKDVIDLSAIDADTGREGDQAFRLVGHLNGHAGQLALAYDAAHGVTLVQGDVDGDGTADLTILISGDQRGFAGFEL